MYSVTGWQNGKEVNIIMHVGYGPSEEFIPVVSVIQPHGSQISIFGHVYLNLKQNGTLIMKGSDDVDMRSFYFYFSFHRLIELE